MNTPGRGALPGRWLAIAASVVVVATVAAAIMAMGPPSAQRQAKLDQRRVQDLAHIANVVSLHVRDHAVLPSDLATLAAEPGRRLSITDPVDGSPYHYEVTGPRTYRLCASFATDTAHDAGAGSGMGDEWNHGSGRHCFDRAPATLR